MSNDNVLEEFAEVDRKLWEEGGGTIDGFFELCHRIAQEDHPKFVAEMERRKAEGTWKSPLDEGGEETAWGHAESPDYTDVMCVGEGDAPKYGAGETSDFARKGAEGE
jgi:hypothetical protein